MDPTMLVYTILTAVLAAVVAEDTRDLRYVPLLVTIGLALIGGLLSLTQIGLTTEPSATIIKSILAVFAIIAGFLYFRNFRAINKLQRDARSCHQGIMKCVSESESRLLTTRAVNENSLKTEIEGETTFKSTTESVEGLQHG